MGQKINPIAIRLGITVDPCSFWYAKRREYAFFVREDDFLRSYVFEKYRQCLVTNVDIERQTERIRLRIHSSKIKLLVGADGRAVDDLTHKLRKECGRYQAFYFRDAFNDREKKAALRKKREIQIYVRQVAHPQVNAKCLADVISLRLQKRIPFRRAIQTAYDQRYSGHNLDRILGFRVQISGRLNGAEIARADSLQKGSVPLSTFCSDLDYARTTARTIYGLLGIKVWVVVRT